MFPKHSEVAWAAGLFEGEGCIYLAGDKRRDPPYLYPGLQLTMNDRDVVERFHRIIGVGSICTSRRSGRKDMWRWQCSNRPGFDHCMKLFEPYLGERRLVKLAEVRAGATAPRNRRKKEYVQ